MAISYVSCGPLEIPEGEPSAVIFDMDGTLVDTMPVHFRAWQAALREVGAEAAFPEELFYAYGGRSAGDILGEMKAKHGFSFDPETVALSKREHYLRLVGDDAPLIQEVIDYLGWAKQRGIPCAVATGSTPKVAEKTLRGAGLIDQFAAILTPADVTKGKPDPEMFLLAAERLGVSASDCLVFEDAEPGIQAAIAAGMEVVRVPKVDA